MAANRFATMVHRNSNKITLILIYAVLEWILIVLLLLNSLFSYLILKFAEYFGLKPPCPWCTRIDHVINPSRKEENSQRDNLCEVHAREVSELGFCANHRKLVDSRLMCDDCSSSRTELLQSSKDFGPLKRLGAVSENGGEVNFNCSCCGVALSNNYNRKYSSYSLVRTSSYDALDKGNLIDYDDSDNVVVDDCNHVAKGFDSGVDLLSDESLFGVKNNEFGFDVNSGIIGGKSKGNGNVEMVLEVEEKETLLEVKSKNWITMDDKSVQVCVEEEENISKHLEFFLDYSGQRLVPIELVDSEHKSGENTEIEEDDKNRDREFIPDSAGKIEEKTDMVVEGGGGGGGVEATFLDIDINEEPKYELLESMELEEDENSRHFLLNQWTSEEVRDDQELDGKCSDVHGDYVAACEKVAQASNENEADVSIGTEIPDLDVTDEIQIQESAHSNGLVRDDDREQATELQSSSNQELNDTEEDKVPDTPTSMESINYLHKKLLMLEKRDSGTEESLDGSITSELDGGDGPATVERLKSALRSERKALQVLYVELEEERSASAVAANQTMAMINRLQEEKAAMQMEALQYQRMMEEQSEYDQEALQLLNELMVKREKEKQELEKELDSCRKKLLEYETREKARALSRSKDGSVFSGDSSDGLSIDLNQEVKDDGLSFYGNQEFSVRDTPVDAVVDLEESLADFEGERLSILEQLKFLEEKLSTLDDESHVHSNGGESNGHAESNGSTTPNSKRIQQRKVATQMGKSLLPLFDAISDGNGELGSAEKANKKRAIEEEVDHLYERLQALEADREFLKHCIRSLEKGDKGTDLLQEILQHLRDLRSVELRVRSSTE
ncbi:myosin-binding protein 2-like [Andrographis paniculata]|uniref:myosin-binding protein 2-like n=1 Tax=Andrographis paniculata TaxID=175694 RepID=UPI0021E7DD3A|nr:myosin-binding protein 2-like [Andrographis paniculata]